MDGIPQHTVVAPVVQTVEGIDRHQLDEVDPELHQMVDPVNRRRQCAFRRERADMQFVDDTAGELTARPFLVGPDELVCVEGPRPPVHTLGLAPGAWIWKHRAGVVENEAVVELADAIIGQRLSREPPSVIVLCHRHFDRGGLADLLDHQRHRGPSWRPHDKPSQAHSSHPTRTGSGTSSTPNLACTPARISRAKLSSSAALAPPLLVSASVCFVDSCAAPFP
jgi:hypothetical protein